MLVMVSSTNFMVGMHICMGEVKNVAIFTKAEACELEQKLPPCHRQMKASCCEDESIVHKGDDLKASNSQILLSTPAPIIIEQSFTQVSEIIPSARLTRIFFYNYDPPLRDNDLTVRIQVFLI